MAHYNTNFANYYYPKEAIAVFHKHRKNLTPEQQKEGDDWEIEGAFRAVCGDYSIPEFIGELLDAE